MWTAKERNLYYIGETRKTPRSRKTGHGFDFETAKAIDRGRFKRGPALGTAGSQSACLASATKLGHPDKC